MLSLRTGRRLCRPPSMVCSLLLMGYCGLLIVWYLFVLLSRSRRLVSLSSSSSSSSSPKSFASSKFRPVSQVVPGVRWALWCWAADGVLVRLCRFRAACRPATSGGCRLVASLGKERLLWANIRQKVFTKKKKR